MLTGAALWVFIPERYSATATLVLDVAPSVGVERLSRGEPDVTTEAIRNQIGKMTARDLLRETVRTLGLADIADYTSSVEPGLGDNLNALLLNALGAPVEKQPITSEARLEAAVDTVAQSFDVFYSGQDYLLHLRYRDVERTRAETVLKELIAQYTAAEEVQSLLRVEETLAVLAPLSDRMRLQAEERAERVARFRSDAKLVDLRLGAAEDQEITAIVEALGEARAEEATLLATIGQEVTSPSDLATIGDTPAVVALRAREADLIVAIAALAPRAGERNPELEAVRAELAEIDGLVKAEIATFMDSLRRRRAAVSERIVRLEELVNERRASLLVIGDARAVLERLEAAASAAEEVYINLELKVAEIAARSESSRIRTYVVTVPTAPYESEKLSSLVYAAGGGALGLLGMSSGVAVLSLSRRRVSNADDFMRVANADACVSLPFVRDFRRTGLIRSIQRSAANAYTESVRGLRTHLLGKSNVGRTSVILISSSKKGEGKTTLAVALAAITAQQGLRVLLIEADLRRPSLARLLGMTSETRADAFMRGESPFDEAVAQHPLGFGFVTAGEPCIPDYASMELRFLDHESIRLGTMWDLIILDTPPVFAVADTLQMAGKVDHCVFVAESGRHSEKMVTEAAHRMRISGAKTLFGAVVRLTPGRDVSGYHEYDGYSGY